MKIRYFFLLGAIICAVIGQFQLLPLAASGFAIAFGFFVPVAFEKMEKNDRLTQELGKSSSVTLQQTKDRLEENFLRSQEEYKKSANARCDLEISRIESELAEKNTQDANKKRHPKEEYDSFSRSVKRFIEPFKDYALEQANQLAKSVEFSELTLRDKKFIVEKIEDEIDVLNRQCRKQRERLVNDHIPLEYEFETEVKALQSLQKYHGYYISDIKRINEMGLSDLRERLYRKQIAEEEYNVLSGSLFPIEHALLYSSLSEDEMLHSEAQNLEDDDEYYE